MERVELPPAYTPHQRRDGLARKKAAYLLSQNIHGKILGTAISLNISISASTELFLRAVHVDDIGRIIGVSSWGAEQAHLESLTPDQIVHLRNLGEEFRNEGMPSQFAETQSMYLEPNLINKVNQVSRRYGLPKPEALSKIVRAVRVSSLGYGLGRNPSEPLHLREEELPLERNIA